jgi:outer membrane protein assembly factor BamB
MKQFWMASFASLCLCGALLLARPDDWPEFRGPTGQGLAYEGTFPVEWSPTKHVAWKQAIPGQGWSSPIVQDARVYLTTSVAVSDSPDKDLSLRALSLDAATGKIRWDVEVLRQNGKNAPRIHPKNSHASPTPITDGKRLFVHFGHQGTACLDLEGKILWRNTSLSYEPVHGSGGSPILVVDQLVFNIDGAEDRFIVALDCQSGQVRWKTPRDVDVVKRFSFSTPLLIDVNGQRQIISPGSNVVQALDPRDGKEIWRVRYEGYSVIPRPVYGHGLVFLCTGYEWPVLLAIRPDGRGDVTETHVAWKSRKAVPQTPSPLLVGDELYLVSDSGIASCLDAKSGRVHWQQRLGGAFSASPLHAGGRIYFENEQGVGTVIKAGKQFQQLARNSLGEPTLASFAPVDETLIIRTEKHLYRIRHE